MKLSIAYDLTWFMRFFSFGRNCLKNAFRSRRVMSNGGPRLSVAYDLPCFMMFFDLQNLFLIDFGA